MAKPRIRSVKFNVLMNMILTSSSLLFPLITVPYVSRVLSTYGTGAVAFAQSVVTYFSLVALLGISSYGVKACAQVRDDAAELSQTVKELLIILTCSTTLVFAVYLLCIFLVPKMYVQKELFLLFGVALWLASFGVEWLYQALEQYEYITIRNVAIKLFCIVLMFVLICEQKDYVMYGAIVVLAGYGSNIFNIIRIRKMVDLRIHTRIDIFRHFKPMLMFFIATVTSGMYVQADLVVLGFLGTTNMVGIYQLVIKIKGTFLTAVNSVGNVMLPRLSYYHAQKAEKRTEVLVAKTLNFSFLVSTLIILLCILERDSIVWLLGGEDFMGAVTPLVAISPAIAISSLNSVIGNYMASNEKEKIWATINVVGLFVAIIANLCLIPHFGPTGAALSAVACELAVFIIRSIQNRDLLKRIIGKLEFIKVAVCGVITYLVCMFFLKLIGTMNVLFSLFVGSALLCSIFLVTLLISREYFVNQVLLKLLSLF